MKAKDYIVGQRRHGHGGTNDGKRKPSPTYMTWAGMHARCSNPKHRSYAEYGGAGVAICARWQIFENFLADMGEKPSGMSLDRWPNESGNYEPGNVRWATAAEQSRNRKRSGFVKLNEGLVQEIHGRREHGESIRSIASRMKVSESTVNDVLKGRSWKGSIDGWGHLSP